MDDAAADTADTLSAGGVATVVRRDTLGNDSARRSDNDSPREGKVRLAMGDKGENAPQRTQDTRRHILRASAAFR